MKQTVMWASAPVLAVALVIYWTRPAPACGPFYFEPVFTETTHPDFPLGPYTRGRLGVLQPAYDRVYLYVAYRNLAGRSFDRAEALALWAIPPESAQLLDEAPEPSPLPPTPPPEPVDWSRTWIDARNNVPNTGRLEYLQDWNSVDGIYRDQDLPRGQREYYLNCPPAAFQAAVHTLRDRTQTHGLTNPILAAWVKAQDQVFANCEKGESIPSALPGDAPPLARADRQYQIAAAYFYAGDFAKAETAFREIADDRNSPWSGTANYLVARTYIRQATVGHDDNAPDPASLANAEAQLKRVLADARSGEFHTSAAGLMDYVEVRLHSDRRVCELAKALMQHPAPADLAQNARDYSFLLDKLENERFDVFNARELQDNRRNIYPKLAGLRARDDLTDWILTFQLDDPLALNHAYEKWHQTNSPAWLVAAISKVQPGDARAAKLVEAAQAAAPSAPAYASVTFHRFRLMMQAGERAPVLPALNRLLAHDAGTLPRSALNLFLAMRMSYAPNLSDFLKYAERVPAENTFPAGRPWFDLDSLIVLNQQMPLSVLTEVAESKALPQYLRREVARGAWTRAFLLGDDEAARKLASLPGGLEPELQANLAAFPGAKTREQRQFTGVLTILRFPGLRPYITNPERSTAIGRIDNFRENWWGHAEPCGLPWHEFAWTVLSASGPQPPITPWPVLEGPLTGIYPKGAVPSPSFLSRAELRQGQRDWERTLALPVAPIELGQAAIGWVRKHPDDPGAAEALALVVRASRFGCPDKETWKLSKQAFDLLHERYPASPWAERTKYWYR